MNILFVTDGIYPFVLGGMQKHAAYLLMQLAKSEHNVHVIHCAPEAVENNTVHLTLFGSIVPNIEFIFIPFPQTLKFPGHYIYSSWLYSKRVSKKIKLLNTHFDVIYCKGFTAWHFLTSRTDKSIPVVSQLHGLEMYQKPYTIHDFLSRSILKIAANKIISLSDYFFTYGGKIKEIFIDKKVPEYKLYEQYGAVDDSWLSPKPGPKQNGIVRKFLFVARFEYRKGFHILRESISQLISLNAAFEIHIVGEIPESEKLVHSSIVYHGNLGAAQILELCNHMEVLLIPSLAEGFPTILIEGMARGLAPIATNVGAINTVVNSTNGWIIPPGNALALREAILSSIHSTSSELQIKQENASTLICENFQWSNTFKLVISHFKHLIDDHRKRSTRK